MVTVQFNPFTPESLSNPYESYRLLREHDPVHYSELMDGWVLTRYDDIVAVLKDPRFSADRRSARNRLVQATMAAQERAGPLARASTMLTSDPPEHSRLRGLAGKAFTARVVDGMRPHIQEIVDQLLDAVQDQGRMDIVSDLAYPLPVIVIAEMLGVPPELRDTFKRWSDDIVSTLGSGVASPELLERGQRSGQEMADYFISVIEERRRDPKDDLLSGLIAAEERGDALSEDELIATCMLLLVAGNETTTNLISNGMLALFRNPGQLELLRSDPSLVESAVEELLRYDPPVQGTGRVAKEPAEIDGRAVEEGQLIFCLLAAANRDPAQFADPERLDLTRGDNRHVAFGFGIHYCLGAPLARIEAQAAFSTLLRRMPALRQAGEPEWGGTFILRGVKKLSLAWG
jgi:cytochrome P450